MKIYGEYSIIQGIKYPKDILLLLAGPQRSCRRLAGVYLPSFFPVGQQRSCRRLPHGCLPSSFPGSALAAGFCGWTSPKAQVIHAGGLFLWMASSSLAYSFRFVPKFFGALPKGLHRRRLECLVVGGEGSHPWPTPHFQIANTPQRDKCFINNILQNGSE